MAVAKNYGREVIGAAECALQKGWPINAMKFGNVFSYEVDKVLHVFFFEINH